MSGRRQAQVAEDARLLGQASYIFEAGSALVLDGEEHWLTGDLTVPGTAHHPRADRRLRRARAAARALRRAPGVPRPVAPQPRGLPPLPRPGRRLRGRHAARRGTATATCAWSTTAPCTAARPRWRICRRCGLTTSCRREPRRPARWPSIAAHAGWPAETAWPSATRARTSATAPHVGAFWLVANAVTKDPSDPRGDRRARQRAPRRGGERAGRLRGGHHDAGGAPRVRRAAAAALRAGCDAAGPGRRAAWGRAADRRGASRRALRPRTADRRCRCRRPRGDPHGARRRLRPRRRVRRARRRRAAARRPAACRPA